MKKIREWVMKKKGEPQDVFLEKSPTTVISLGWYNKDYVLTAHGEKMMETILKNHNN